MPVLRENNDAGNYTLTSLSRPLLSQPRQMYLEMPRTRFLIANDPNLGNTIVTELLKLIKQKK